jgi:hypothetical protein
MNIVLLRRIAGSRPARSGVYKRCLADNPGKGTFKEAVPPCLPRWSTIFWINQDVFPGKPAPTPDQSRGMPIRTMF